MKVKDLIKKLEKCDPESEVLTEGCDCYGDVGFVDPDYSGGAFLARKDGMYYKEVIRKND